MVRGLASLCANMFHIVALEGSGITSLEDLRGAEACLGRCAGLPAPRVNAAAILESNGITYDDIDEQRLNFNETADALANGDIDAEVLVGGRADLVDPEPGDDPGHNHHRADRSTAHGCNGG